MSKRQEAEKWLEAWAIKAGGDLDGLLSALADFSMNPPYDDSSRFVYKTILVHEYPEEQDELEDEDGNKLTLASKEEQDLLWKHYKTLTGVSPWDKECRGCG